MLKVLKFAKQSEFIGIVEKTILEIYNDVEFFNYEDDKEYLKTSNIFDFIIVDEYQDFESDLLNFRTLPSYSLLPGIFLVSNLADSVIERLIKPGVDISIPKTNDLKLISVIVNFFLKNKLKDKFLKDQPVCTGANFSNCESSWSLFNLILNGILIANTEGTILFANKAYHEIFGFDKGSVIGHKIWERVLNSDEFKEYFEAIKIQEDVHRSFYYKEQDQQGELLQLRIRHSRYICETNNLSYFVFAISDVTQSKKNEEELKFERELLAQLMNNIPDTIYFKNINKKFIRVNRSQCNIIGVNDPELAVGKTDYDFFPKEIADKSSSDEDVVLKGGLPLIDVEELIKDVNGNEYWMSVTKNAIKNENGEITGLVGISRDITPRKETLRQLELAKQNAEQADKLKTAFLANMSHEIRTPMNTIIGFSELLKNSSLTHSERLEYLEYICEGGNTLLTLIDDIIDFSKIESGQITIKRQACNINALITDVINLSEHERQRRCKDNVRLLSDIPVVLEEFFVNSDPERLKQVLMNIINNALKFTDNGYIKIGYVLLEDEIQFYIKDTGIGIDEKMKTLVFERFGQVDFSFTRNQGGTGLGLSISKSIIELLGGKIWFESVLGKGTTFFFTIPFNLIQKKPISSKDIHNVETVTPDWSNKFIVVAEDEINNFKFIEAILKPTNALTLRVENGEELIQLIKNSDYHIDLILCDLKMPVMDGYTAVSIIRNELKNKIPVIAQTAYALIGEKQRCFDIGFTDYLSKPIKVKELITMLGKYIV